MKNCLKVSIFIFALFSLTAQAQSRMSRKSPIQNKVIYGVDDRFDLFEILDRDVKDYSSAVLSVVFERSYKIDEDENLTLFAKSLGEELNICKNEKYVDQPFAADCTAFLIAPNIAITAGHCVLSEIDCEHKVFLQGFSKTYATEDLLEKIFSPSSYAKCTEVLMREKDRNTGIDYAVVRFDKDFTSKNYFKLPKETSHALNNKNLMIMGHPSKLPLKITTNFKVRSEENSNFFVVNSDTFQGNSGSPVFDKESGEVFGIIVRGERDYIQNENETCLRPKICAENECRGEDAVRTSLIDQNLLAPYLKVKTISDQNYMINGLSHNKNSTKDGFGD